MRCNHTIHQEKHHYGWDNSIEPLMSIKAGETVTVETIDASGGQLSEKSHEGDLLKASKTILTKDNYIVFSCYNCVSDDLTKKLLKNIKLINNQNFHHKNKFHWYNHPTKRP